MPKPKIDNLGQRDATDVREARAGVTQLPDLPVAVLMAANQDYTFALTLAQANQLFMSLETAIRNAVAMYGIPPEMLTTQIIKPGGH